MKLTSHLILLILTAFLYSCSEEKPEKGFQISSYSEDGKTENENGFNNDSLVIKTTPGSVVLTGISNIRLTTVYKINQRKDKTTFAGSNSFHYSYNDQEDDPHNNWNSHIIPGLEALYGYNLVNISHYDISSNEQKTFFKKPVLVRTLYFPSFSSDTLNGRPVKRDFFIISAYSEDTNKDGFINTKDLRRIYLFDKNGTLQKALIPENYSVFKSEYDSANDFMYIYARLDINKDGSSNKEEPIHIFWTDLKNPSLTGRQF